VVDEIRRGRELGASLRAHALPIGGVLGKSFLVAAYNEMVADGTLAADPSLFEKLRMKPVRTLSGVTTVTVLTKPYPCPGKCIFCPTDVRMPKSYLPDEPGAMRGVEHNFDPYAQVRSRNWKTSAIPPTRSNCLSSVVRGARIKGIIRNGSWHVVSMP
jgi:elongator complex protein 3